MMYAASRNDRIEKAENEGMANANIPRLKPIPVRPLSEEGARNIFTAYFNNKMTVILLVLQKRNVCPADSAHALRASLFIEDLYHHMLSRNYQQSHGRVFRWLRIFLKQYPAVKPLQKQKAIAFIRVVYQLFGIEWRLGI